MPSMIIELNCGLRGVEDSQYDVRRMRTPLLAALATSPVLLFANKQYSRCDVSYKTLVKVRTSVLWYSYLGLF